MEVLVKLPIFRLSNFKLYRKMDKNDLRLIIAQQVVLLKRIEDLEYKLKVGPWKSTSISSYQSKLKEEAMKIIDQIEA